MRLLAAFLPVFILRCGAESGGSEGAADTGADTADSAADTDGVVSVPVLVVDPAEVDFGDVPVRGSASVDLIISNVGDAPLTIEEITMGPTVRPFGMDTREDLDGPFPRTLPPGTGWMRVTVGLGPEEVGEFETTVTIRSDDPVNPALEITLRGNGV